MSRRGHPPLIVIVGPTGVGKTAIAIYLAEELGGEIISADSRQVYRHMSIGTAKPTPSEICRVPHHLVDILDPDDRLTLADFQRRAYAAIDQVLASDKLPLLVGGTGQYVHAVVEGWGIPHVTPHHDLRADIEAVAAIYGATTLHAWLAKVDPDAASMIDRRNVRRVVRAVEVYEISGQPISQLRIRHPPPYCILQIGLTRPRKRLYERIDARIDHMMDSGLLQEVEHLTALGYDQGLPSMSGLGYAQIGAYLRGEISLEEAVALIKRDTRRFIRKQYNWFPLTDSSITWFDLEETPKDAILAAVCSWLCDK